MPASKDQESEEGDGIKGLICKSGELLRVVLPQLMLSVDPEAHPMLYTPCLSPFLPWDLLGLPKSEAMPS